MRDRKNEFLFLFPLVFFYLVFDILLIYLPLDSIVSKSLMVGNVLIFSPLVTLLVSLLYAVIYGFSLHFSILVGLLFLLTIFIFGEWIPLYHLVYFLSSLAGNGLGHLFYHLRKKKSEARKM